MDGNVLYVAVSTEEGLERLRPATKDENIVNEQDMSIKTEQESVDFMSGPIHFS